jgi:hypothetical protein
MLDGAGLGQSKLTGSLQFKPQRECGHLALQGRLQGSQGFLGS